MKRYMIEFEEVCRGVIEVFANDEDEAREIAECEGDKFINKSFIELGNIQSEEDIEDY